MTMDHRLREVVDAFVARVRRDMDAHVQGLTADLLRLGTENQEYWRSTLERAVTDARQDAERAEYQEYLDDQSSSGGMTTIGDKLGHLFKRED